MAPSAAKAHISERPKIAQSRTLAKVRYGDVPTFYERLKTLASSI